MTDFDHDRAEQMMTRLTTTYRMAMAASHAGGRISIHVAPDVWEGLKRGMRDVAPSVDSWSTPTCWGFDILEEAAWGDGRIEVRTTVRIA